MGFKCFLMGHKWNYCTCERCGLTKGVDDNDLSSHLWNGCTCKVCGRIRDEGHDWQGCKCNICGRTRNAGHTIRNGRCIVCKKRIDKGELLNAFKSNQWFIEHNPRMLIDNDPAERLKEAFAALSPEDAYDVLLQAYVKIFEDYRDNPDDKIRDYIVPYVNSTVFYNLYRYSSGKIQHVSQFFDNEIIIKISHELFEDDKERKRFLQSCKVVDGTLLTDCDLGNHKLVFDREEWTEPSLTADSIGRSSEYKIFHCAVCGKVIKKPTGRYSVG